MRVASHSSGLLLEAPSLSLSLSLPLLLLLRLLRLLLLLLLLLRLLVVLVLSVSSCMYRGRLFDVFRVGERFRLVGAITRRARKRSSRNLRPRPWSAMRLCTFWVLSSVQAQGSYAGRELLTYHVDQSGACKARRVRLRVFERVCECKKYLTP